MNPIDAALYCEVRKWSYRQTKEGVVVAFLIHPNELPDGLAISPLGTRYMLAACEIGDDEQPTVQPEKQTAKRPVNRFVQRAGILASDQEFQNFIRATFAPSWEMAAGDDEEKTAQIIRHMCGVTSRKELATNEKAAGLFDSLLTRFEGWRRAIE